MATNRKKQLAAVSEPPLRDKATREALSIKVEQGDPKLYRTIAAQLTNTTAGAAMSMQKIDPGKWLDVDALVEVLREQAKTVSAGDMRQPEAMLLGQAQTLEALFYHFTRSGMAQNSLPQFEAHFRLALRAQSQSRMALEALAEIKNPRAIAFVKQANIAGGHQQVNNGAPSPAEKKETTPNELLKELTHEALDNRGAAAAGATNPKMEAVGAIHRRTNARGKSKGSAERPQG